MTKDEMVLVSHSEVENAVCEKVLPEEADEMKELSEEMIKFCVDKGGLGLSGPQIGINKQIIVWQSKVNLYQVGFNTSYFKDKKRTNTIEGCLTYPDESYHLEGVRSKKINAVYEVPDKKGGLVRIYKKMNNEEALVFQHETDHINGITIAMIGRKIE